MTSNRRLAKNSAVLLLALGVLASADATAVDAAQTVHPDGAADPAGQITGYAYKEVNDLVEAQGIRGQGRIKFCREKFPDKNRISFSS